MIPETPTRAKELAALLKLGEGKTLEFKRSTGDIVDNRQERMNAFAMVREGLAFLERTMPLGARFPAGQIFREDRFPVRTLLYHPGAISAESAKAKRNRNTTATERSWTRNRARLMRISRRWRRS